MPHQFWSTWTPWVSFPGFHDFAKWQKMQWFWHLLRQLSNWAMNPPHAPPGKPQSNNIDKKKKVPFPWVWREGVFEAVHELEYIRSTKKGSHLFSTPFHGSNNEMHTEIFGDFSTRPTVTMNLKKSAHHHCLIRTSPGPRVRAYIVYHQPMTINHYKVGPPGSSYKCGSYNPERNGLTTIG